jgi:hypothetical protein
VHAAGDARGGADLGEGRRGKAAQVSKEDETGQWTRITPRHESEVLLRNAVCATPK